MLADLPMVFALAGLALYVVLAGADFGAALWQAAAGRGAGAQRRRDQAHRSMGPVWEANHVWLIFVFTVVWTAYPVAFGSLASTLSVPLFIAAVGIIIRGTAYALRSGARSAREVRLIDGVFSASAVLTPFALGAAVGGLASLRVPVGNAAGHLIDSWLNPTSIAIGILAVATSAHLAAVFLAGDAMRLGDPGLAREFRVRALASGVLTGAIAAAGVVVLHADAGPVYHGLVHGPGLVALIVSALAGIGTVALVWRNRFEPARYAAAVAVAAVVAGWALAQQPTLLRGLTIRQAAAPHDVLVAVVIVVVAGGAILFPSLGLLFRLFLTGRLMRGPAPSQEEPAPGTLLAASARGLLGRITVACLLVGIGFLTGADTTWAHAVGVVALLAFMALGWFAATPAQIAVESDARPGRP